MDGRNPRTRAHLTMDLIEVLLEADAVCPDSITVSEVQAWFSARERQLAADIVAELAGTSDTPVEFVTAERVSIWLTDRAAARAYLADLRENRRGSTRERSVSVSTACRWCVLPQCESRDGNATGVRSTIEANVP